MLRQKLTNGIFSPQPIFSISRRERVGGISIHPFGPLRSIKVDGRISPCGEFPNYSGFSGPGHAGNQYALHVCFLPMATHCWYRLLARGGRVLPAGLRPELFLGATDCQRERLGLCKELFGRNWARSLVIVIASAPKRLRQLNL